MNYYFSGIGNFTYEQKERLAYLCRYRLQSCHRDYVKQTKDWLNFASKGLAKGKIEIMLDSGAFTAWGKGKEIELDPLINIYSELIETYEDNLKAVWLINLDKIPGQRGRTATPEEIEEAERISDKNFNVLQKMFGPRVLPVFHQNESGERLKTVGQMGAYICISPRNDLGEKHRISWAAEVHTLLRGTGWRTHGLATTGMSMANMVPWYSADSAWWLQTAINGSIMYLSQEGIIKTLLVSQQSPGRKDKNQHYISIAKKAQQYIDERLAVHGYTYKDVSEHHNPRMMVCILEVLEWLQIAKVQPMTAGGLFDL